MQRKEKTIICFVVVHGNFVMKTFLQLQTLLHIKTTQTLCFNYSKLYYASMFLYLVYNVYEIFVYLETSRSDCRCRFYCFIIALSITFSHFAAPFSLLFINRAAQQLLIYDCHQLRDRSFHLSHKRGDLFYALYKPNFIYYLPTYQMQLFISR